MELMYFVIRHMEEASRAKRLRRRNEKIEKMGGVVAGKHRVLWVFLLLLHSDEK